MLKDLSLTKRITLKAITKVQRFLLRRSGDQATNLYYYLARLHFKVYFGRDLRNDIMDNTEDGYKAAKRHSRLVVSTLYKDSDSVRQKMVKAASRGSFTKNFLIDMDL